MPTFPIEFTAKSTTHQRQIIHVEADNIEDAIAAVEAYDIDNSQATDLGKPTFTEWLVYDVKAYDPENSPLILPASILTPELTSVAKAVCRYHARDITYVTDGAEIELPSEMEVEIDASTPEAQREEIITNTISDRTGWLVESLQLTFVDGGDEVERITAPV